MATLCSWLGPDTKNSSTSPRVDVAQRSNSGSSANILASRWAPRMFNSLHLFEQFLSLGERERSHFTSPPTEPAEPNGSFWSLSVCGVWVCGPSLLPCSLLVCYCSQLFTEATYRLHMLYTEPRLNVMLLFFVLCIHLWFFALIFRSRYTSHDNYWSKK